MNALGLNLQQFKLVMALALVLVSLLIWRSLSKRDRSAHSSLNFDDLLLGDDGRMSKGAFVMLGAFATTTWMMIYLTLTEKITEGYYGIYSAAWIAPTVARLIAGPKSEVTSDTSTTTSSSTVVKPVPPAGE